MMSAMPLEYISSLCTPPIVGATILDCGSTNQNFCLAYVEEHRNKALAVLDGNVLKPGLKDSQAFTCPLCHSPCNHKICHALDADVLRYVWNQII